MNVVFLSDHGSQGGAAVAAGGVIRSLMEGNHGDVFHHILFFKDDATSTAGQGTLHPLWYEETGLKRHLYRLPRKLLTGIFPRPHTKEFAARRLRAKLAGLRPDVINVHNLHAAAPWGWGPHLVEVCLEFAPVVWTLHDMWSFTGRCAYSYDCRKFITGCDASCPTPTENPALAPDQIRAAWEERRYIYARHHSDLVLVAPSRWLADEARAGLFAEHRVEVIPYGLPLWFHGWHSLSPAARADARRELGINPAGPVLLIAAFDLGERRKGAEILPRLWQHIQQRPLTVLTMGRGAIAIDDPLIEVHAGSASSTTIGARPSPTPRPTSCCIRLPSITSPTSSSKRWPAAPRPSRCRSADCRRWCVPASPAGSPTRRPPRHWGKPSIAQCAILRWARTCANLAGRWRKRSIRWSCKADVIFNCFSSCGGAEIMGQCVGLRLAFAPWHANARRHQGGSS